MLTALRGTSLPQRLSFPQYLPKRLGLAWVEVMNPNYWRVMLNSRRCASASGE